MRHELGRRGFTIIDVMVSMAVIAVLIGLLTPTLWSVRETARRVICGSNVRQLGIGIALYADDNRDFLPPSQFVGKNKAQEMLRVHVEVQADGVSRAGWDGLGHLFIGNYLPEAQVFYCPSHAGANTYSVYHQMWHDGTGSIPCNYQFRGEGPNKERRLSLIEPTSAALVADGLRTQVDFNHKVGGNVLRADLSVYWYRDSAGHIIAALPPLEGQNDATGKAWKMLDYELAK